MVSWRDRFVKSTQTRKRHQWTPMLDSSSTSTISGQRRRVKYPLLILATRDGKWCLHRRRMSGVISRRTQRSHMQINNKRNLQTQYIGHTAAPTVAGRCPQTNSMNNVDWHSLCFINMNQPHKEKEKKTSCTLTNIGQNWTLRITHHANDRSKHWEIKKRNQVKRNSKRST